MKVAWAVLKSFEYLNALPGSLLKKETRRHHLARREKADLITENPNLNLNSMEFQSHVCSRYYSLLHPHYRERCAHYHPKKKAKSTRISKLNSLDGSFVVFWRRIAYGKRHKEV